MVRKEELGPQTKIELEVFAGSDHARRVNTAWVELNGSCRARREELDWSSHWLCTSSDNTGTHIQNAQLDKRCALPWCPFAIELSIVAMGRACWYPQIKS